MASGGYPNSYEKGFPITGLHEAEALPEVVVFQAGTVERDGELLTAGGRVLGVTAVGESLAEALERAYAGIRKISFRNMYYRKDIGAQTLTDDHESA